MPPFDATMTDPTPDAVAKAMAEAVETANRRCTKGLLQADRGEYRRFLASEFPEAPEGVAIWLAEKGRVDEFPPTPRATLLGVVWYTTPLGRRTVRVAGRRVEPFNENASNRFGPPWRRWPPLCLLDPDHVVVRSLAGGAPEAIALCDCGAVGPPAKLAWVGGRCGPCHDHLEEHGTPLAAADGPSVLRTAGQLIDVGFLPSGNTLAAVEWLPQGVGLQIAAWVRKTGECRYPSAAGGAGWVSPDDPGSGRPLSRGWRLFWVAEDPGKPLQVRPGPDKSAVNAVAFWGTLAAAVTYDGECWRRELTVPGDWQQCWPARRGDRDDIYFTMALSPGGTKAALGRMRGAVELLDWPGGTGPTLRPALLEIELIDQRVYTLAFSPDGKLLAAGTGTSGFVYDPSQEWHGRGGGIYLYDAALGEYLAGFPTPKDDIMAVAFSPDGSLLFCGSTDCTVRVFDVAARKEIAVLSGHVGGVNALAFSPDGETLASAGGDGLVRLWPWRQVLERPAAPKEISRKGARTAKKRKKSDG
jgi:hypothetical protein